MGRIEFKNDFLLSKQGGLVLTHTDDNGLITPLELACGRAGEKTGVNKDGLIYTAKSYEPTFKMVDGDINLHLESNSSTNLIEHSEDFTDSYWVSTTNIDTVLGSSISPDNSIGYTSLISNNSTELNEHRVRTSAPQLTSTTYTLKIRAKSVGGCFLNIRILSTGAEINVDLGAVSFLDSHSSISEYHIKDLGVYGVEIGLVFTTPNSFANSLIDFGATTVIDNLTSVVPIGQGVELWGAELKEGSVLTESYIPTSGATGVRLSDTGFKTADFSNVLNTSSFSIEVLGTFRNNKQGTIMMSSKDGSSSLILIARAGADHISIVGIKDSSTEFIDNVAFVYGSESLINVNCTGEVIVMKINDIEVYSKSDFSGFKDSGLSFFSFERLNGDDPLDAYIKRFKIES